jgi:hypothetical protein
MAPWLVNTGWDGHHQPEQTRRLLRSSGGFNFLCGLSAALDFGLGMGSFWLQDAICISAVSEFPGYAVKVMSDVIAVVW